MDCNAPVSCLLHHHYCHQGFPEEGNVRGGGLSHFGSYGKCCHPWITSQHVPTQMQLLHLGEAIAVIVGLKNGLGQTLSLLRASSVSTSSQVPHSSQDAGFLVDIVCEGRVCSTAPLHRIIMLRKMLDDVADDKTFQSQWGKIAEQRQIQALFHRLHGSSCDSCHLGYWFYHRTER